MRWFGIMFASQMKMQKRIVNLIQQGLVRFIATASLTLQIGWYGPPPVVKASLHFIGVTATYILNVMTVLQTQNKVIAVYIRWLQMMATIMNYFQPAAS